MEQPFSASVAAILLFAAAFIYTVGGLIYRLYFSPIAHFPGPKIAAATHLYGFYYDAIRGGQYVWKVAQMHQKYGPVVRINPNEIHISDPDYYAVLYASAKSVAINVYRLEPVIQDKIDEMLEHVVMEYAFARSDRRLAQPDFDPVFLNALTSASDISHWVLHLNWILGLFQSIPVWLARLFNPGFVSHRTHTTWLRVKDQIRDIQNGTNRSNEKSSHRTIFHDVLDSGMPASEKKLERMWQEGMVVVGAGTDTTAWTLVVVLVHIIINADIRQRLEDEVRTAIATKGQLKLSDLEQLPYLSACIKEALRLSYGLSARLPRVAPTQVLEVPGTTGLAIPPGTKVSMNSVLMHRHPQLFPQPDEFRPERWLDNPRLDRYLVPFSKGARQCLGINLAYAEVYMALGAIVGRFSVTDGGPRLQLVDNEASLRSIEIAGDMFLPSTKSGNKHIEAVFR
ncbi:hypothetical protein ABOM_002892 [Aspergillus bombycis]|uniref:Cytochrome P450 n=1 Tax=Aspergillus bombycis TaxID=109264 RepID=A0A1F8A9T5_9EURO|nr:hypothetical protein ABOM_002892 [Aspergillus bombycis]OGM48078.1 hypothetical protein ABOM_002892 [Aspergillus bombycis]